MSEEFVPMRWPREWNQPAHFELLRGTRVNFILVDDAADLSRLQGAAQSVGLPVSVSTAPPARIEVISGEWPGVSAGPGKRDGAVSGPTGEPWLSSNGWKVLLAGALHPGKEIWVDTLPPKQRPAAESYEIAVADAAANGGTWVINLDGPFADGLVKGGNIEVAVWGRITAALDFVAKLPRIGLKPAATIGVLSDFTGANEFLSTELLNLLARDSQQIRVLPMDRLALADLSGLRAIIYPDQSAPQSGVRRRVSDFIAQGGLLVAGSVWGDTPGKTVGSESLPGYGVIKRGKGRIAIARKPMEDPYLLAKDVILLVSHRFDVVRIWNGGALRACLSCAPDGNRGLLQLVSYANDPPRDMTVRVSGSWHTATLLTVDEKKGHIVPLLRQDGAAEVHLDEPAHHSAIQLDV